MRTRSARSKTPSIMTEYECRRRAAITSVIVKSRLQTNENRSSFSSVFSFAAVFFRRRRRLFFSFPDGSASLRCISDFIKFPSLRSEKSRRSAFSPPKGTRPSPHTDRYNYRCRNRFESFRIIPHRKSGARRITGNTSQFHTPPGTRRAPAGRTGNTRTDGAAS